MTASHSLKSPSLAGATINCVTTSRMSTQKHQADTQRNEANLV